MPENLRTVVVIDYQNLHLVAHRHFAPSSPIHQCRISPGMFARRLISVRNAARRQPAELIEVQVFRGLPEPEYNLLDYQRNLAQQQQWERDSRVHITHLPLRYRVLSNNFSTGPGPGRVEPEVEVREKGIDVLCALAVVSAAQRDDIDLVIVASHDSDLDPAIAAVQRSGNACVEGMQWVGGRGEPRGHLHGDSSFGRLWCTRLGPEDFHASRDPVDYTNPCCITYPEGAA